MLVLVYGIITFGIYHIIWYVKTKREMVARGADIPTSWLMIIPLVNFWWFWIYCEGVEKTTKGKLSGIGMFLLLMIVGFILPSVVQSAFNDLPE